MIVTKKLKSKDQIYVMSVSLVNLKINSNWYDKIDP